MEHLVSLNATLYSLEMTVLQSCFHAVEDSFSLQKRFRWNMVHGASYVMQKDAYLTDKCYEENG